MDSQEGLNSSNSSQLFLVTKPLPKPIPVLVLEGWTFTRRSAGMKETPENEL